MEKKINDPWSTKKVENDFTHPPIPRGKKMKPFRWHERRHVPIDRSLIRKHVNQRKYPQGILLAVSFQPDVEKFQTARNIRTLFDVNFFNVLKTRGTGRWTQSMSFERAREENARVAKGWFRSRNIKFTRSFRAFAAVAREKLSLHFFDVRFYSLLSFLLYSQLSPIPRRYLDRRYLINTEERKMYPLLFSMLHQNLPFPFPSNVPIDFRWKNWKIEDEKSRWGEKGRGRYNVIRILSCFGKFQRAV